MRPFGKIPTTNQPMTPDHFPIPYAECNVSSTKPSSAVL